VHVIWFLNMQVFLSSSFASSRLLLPLLLLVKPVVVALGAASSFLPLSSLSSFALIPHSLLPIFLRDGCCFSCLPLIFKVVLFLLLFEHRDSHTHTHTRTHTTHMHGAQFRKCFCFFSFACLAHGWRTHTDNLFLFLFPFPWLAMASSPFPPL